MRVMWVTFAPIGHAARVLSGGATQSGGWIDATAVALATYIKNGSVELHVVALGDKDCVVCDEETSTVFHMVKMQRFRGARNPRGDRRIWQRLIAEISPDVIQIWGTEFSFGLDIEAVAGDIPVCFYIQGVVSSLAQHPAGDVSAFELLKTCGPTAAFKLRSMRKEIKSNKKHKDIEAEMISRSHGIIADNEWTKAQYIQYTQSFYNVPLALNEIFCRSEWSFDKCKRHSIFTVAGGASPIKGVHNAVLAVALLKNKYPDIKLYIPGSISSRKPHFLYDTVFVRHIRALIAKYDLSSNVEFVGRLSPSDMALQMCLANVFVMPSCVETHSSSMREAMTVGCPTVSAVAGCAAEMVEHGNNGYLYRYGEIETLAYYIDKIFSDEELAERMSQSARRTMSEKFPQDCIGRMLVDAYETMLAKKSEEESDEK